MKPDYNKLSDTVFDALFWGVFAVLMAVVAWFSWSASVSLAANILGSMIFMTIAAAVYLLLFAPLVGFLALMCSGIVTGIVAMFYHFKNRRYQPLL